ncbi:MAG: AAA family ATPase [Candidatus Izemoplasmatales bacterium]|nr:AAA family ATPase [Candidatus Izemoplasmatales bacterium]
MNKLNDLNQNGWLESNVDDGFKDEDLDSDGLPEVISADTFLNNLPKLPSELIEGVVRVGHKMMISGASKSGKSFLLMQLAIALSEGTKWLGFQCKKSKVLYVNLEIDRASFIHRFTNIYEALKLKPKHSHDISIWNLRGIARPLDKLAPILIRRVVSRGYDAIIIDPIYKVITGDENSASDMGIFTNLFDMISKETGCTIIFSHHHSKGPQGFKKAMDRASGSGVFARDPDALVDLIELSITEDLRSNNNRNKTCTAWRMESSLREFNNFKPLNFWFEYPIHKVDEQNKLDKKYAAGDTRANLEKSGKRSQTPEDRKEVFDKAFKTLLDTVGNCTIEDLIKYLNLSERTIRQRLSEFNDEYISSKGNIFRLKNKENL